MNDLDWEKERRDGNEHFKRQDYTKALEVYLGTCLRIEKAVEQGPEVRSDASMITQLSLLYFNISVAYTKMGFLRDAGAFIDKALEINACDKFLARKALILLKHGDYRSALEITGRIKDKSECKMIQSVRCSDLEDFLRVINYPIDFWWELKFVGDDLVVDLDLLMMVSTAYSEGAVLPAKLMCAILREGYAVLNNLDNIVFIDTEDEVLVLGDTHGQYFDVVSITNKINLANNVKIVFNGDLVDRGDNSVENFIFVLLLKIVFPDKVFVNRGNHEFEDLNKVSGFIAEIKVKYKLMHDIVYLFFSKVFSCLPIVTVLNRKVFITHGGLPAEPLSINEIQQINRKLQVSVTDPKFAGLMWSDPGDIDDVLPSKRGIGVVFGRNVTERFLDQNNLELIVRSHECVTDGFYSQHDGNVLTIFSAPNYCQSTSLGAFLRFSWPGNDDVNYEVVTFAKCYEKECFRLA